jgi:hypothetical protein
MSILLSGADLIDLAVQTEERGESVLSSRQQRRRKRQRRANCSPTWPSKKCATSAIFPGACPRLSSSPRWTQPPGKRRWPTSQSTVDRAFFTADAPIRAVLQGSHGGREAEQPRHRVRTADAALSSMPCATWPSRSTARSSTRSWRRRRRHVARQLAALREQYQARRAALTTVYSLRRRMELALVEHPVLDDHRREVQVKRRSLARLAQRR